MAAVELTIDQLLLDTANPRIGQAANQRDALQKVLDDQGEKLLALAASIVAEGMSPIDRLLVLREKLGAERFITLEGNRRTAALKLLAEPTLLSSLSMPAGLQKRLTAQSQQFDRESVEPLSGFEVEDRQEATQWLYLRHTGQNAGQGVVNWSGLATSRFRGSDPALQALEFVKQYGAISEDERGHLDDDFPITTLDRLLASREVRSRLGFEIKEKKLQSGLPPGELIKPLTKMVLDLALKRINVSRLKNKQQQVEYIDGFAAEYKPNLKLLGSPKAVESIRAAEFTIKTKPHRSPKSTKRDPSDRSTLIPKTIRLDIEDSKTAQLFGELRDLKLKDAPLAIAIEFRVFLEHSVDHYLDKHKLPTHGVDQKSGKRFEKNLHTKFSDVLAHLKNHSETNPKDFLAVTRALSDKTSPLNVDLLHAYVHNRFTIPRERDLRSAWDEAQPFFKAVWA